MKENNCFILDYLRGASLFQAFCWSDRHHVYVATLDNDPASICCIVLKNTGLDYSVKLNNGNKKSHVSV